VTGKIEKKGEKHIILGKLGLWAAGEAGFSCPDAPGLAILVGSQARRLHRSEGFRHPLGRSPGALEETEKTQHEGEERDKGTTHSVLRKSGAK